MIPGGHVAASQAIAAQIDSARERLDLMNPYVTDGPMIDRIVAAAQRGVQVRLVISQKSNNAQATAALKHRYPDLLEAGVAVWVGETSAGVMGSSANGRGLAMLHLSRVGDALAAGTPIMSGGIALHPVKPDWARFDWPGEAKAE